MSEDERKQTPSSKADDISRPCCGREQRDALQHQFHHILVELVFQHIDFQIAELTSVLDMYDINIEDVKWRKLPREGQEEHLSDDRPVVRPFCLLSFPKATALNAKYCLDDDDESEKTTAISTIISKCTMIRSVVEVWGMGESMDECKMDVQRYLTESNKRVERLRKDSWKLTIHTLGAKFSREEQDPMRKRFGDILPLDGPVKLKDPDQEFLLIRETEMDKYGSPFFPRRNHEGKPNHINRRPLAVYFGRIIGKQGRLTKGRGGVHEYTLKKRSYLGPTSMDTELSFIMANLAQVQQSSIVFDPFVGTGSILVSCAIKGAYCIGADIDLRVLRGRSSEENVLSNFRQYNLPLPELIRSDNAIYHRHYRDHEPMYDAIVTDPPYGIRAGARQTGSRLENPRPILDEHRHDHIAQTKPYPVADVMADLLDVAARTLVMGGRLVYIIPSFATDFSIEDDLPRHPCLNLMHVCYQPFTAELGRRVVAMKKIAVYDPSLRQAEYLPKVWKNGAESAEKCANIRAKIYEAAKKKPNYEEKLAFRKQKRKASKEARKRAKQQEAQEMLNEQSTAASLLSG